MQTLEQPRSSRNALFWSLHTAGWGAYGIAQSFGALLNQRHGGYMEVIWIATLTGFILSIPMRYIYRRLWRRPAFVVAVSVLATCYLTALAVRSGINFA